MIRLAIIHEVPLIADLIASVLKNEADISIVGCARSAEEALSWLPQRTCDVCLVNMTLPDEGVWKLTKAVSDGLISTKILVTGLVRSRVAIVKCLEAGATGYILADEPLPELVKRVRAVHEDKFIIPPEIATALMSRIAELKRTMNEFNDARALTLPESHKPLTQREREVLELIAQGCSNQEIARSLVIEVGTVKNHVHNILSKLDAPSREHAVLFAKQILGHSSSSGVNSG
jgi:DNA-binding NarL/FixJ family response regulator